MKNNKKAFIPHFSISSRLLEIIKSITAQSVLLNNKKLPDVVLAEFERHAREISSYSSTSIEGNPLPLTEVKKILKNSPQNITDSQKEVLNYNNALLKLNKTISKNNKLDIDLKFVLGIHKDIMEGLLVKSKTGALRQEPVFVNDPVKKQTIYWPPDHQDVPGLMSALLEFVKSNEKKLDPIIISGIFHKQFVVIHPFIDGNGRTVRLVSKAILASMGLNTFNLFSFENFYNKNITKYFENVGSKGNYYDTADSLDFTPWLEYFAEGILDELYRVSKELDMAVVTPSRILAEHHKKLLAYIEKNGFINDKEYSKITGRAKPTRTLDFSKLTEQGYIERFGKGKATYYKLKK